MKKKVFSIEQFGLFLDDGGFVHVSDLTESTGRRYTSKAEIEGEFPIGKEVDVVIKNMQTEAGDILFTPNQKHYNLAAK